MKLVLPASTSQHRACCPSLSCNAERPTHTRLPHPSPPLQQSIGRGLTQPRRHLALERIRTCDSAAGALSSFDQPEPDPSSSTSQQNVQVFPRRKERDPYKRLGVPQDASFEEVQDARNFLYEQYKAHEQSRESIELAFDAILQQKYKLRNKYGFRPPSTGRKTDLAGDELKLNLWQAFKERLEPSVPATTIVNDGSIFLVLAVWSAWMSAAYDPTLPLGAAITFSVYRLFAKRKNRSPDGPFWGNSPVWGALGTTMLGLIVGGIISWLLVQFLPLPAQLRSEAVGIFIMTTILGIFSIFLK